MILAILLTAIVYLILQRIDDNRKEKNNEPISSWGSRIGLLFFVAIVCFVITYLFENMNPDKNDNFAFVEGGNYEQGMLHSINESIHVGMPPF
jgi:amino acid transporter